MITFKLPEFRSDGGNFLSRFILCPFRIRTRSTAGFVFPGMARHVQVASMVLSPRSDRVLGLPDKRRCTAQRNALQNIGSIVRFRASLPTRPMPAGIGRSLRCRVRDELATLPDIVRAQCADWFLKTISYGPSALSARVAIPAQPQWFSNTRDSFDRRTFDLHFRVRSGLFANRLNLNATAGPSRFINRVNHTHIGRSFATRRFRRAIIQNAI
jgi:hypothetical protein